MNTKGHIMTYPVLLINKATKVIFSVNEKGYVHYVTDYKTCRPATKDEVLSMTWQSSNEH